MLSCSTSISQNQALVTGSQALEVQAIHDGVDECALSLVLTNTLNEVLNPTNLEVLLELESNQYEKILNDNNMLTYFNPTVIWPNSVLEINFSVNLDHPPPLKLWVVIHATMQNQNVSFVGQSQCE